MIILRIIAFICMIRSAFLLLIQVRHEQGGVFRACLNCIVIIASAVLLIASFYTNSAG